MRRITLITGTLWAIALMGIVFFSPSVSAPAGAQGVADPTAWVYLPFLRRDPTPTPTPTLTPSPTLPPSSHLYRLTEMRHLTACENKGKHNVFVKIVDAMGNPLDGVQVVFRATGGGQIFAVRISGDKGPGMLEFDMYRDGAYSVYVTEDGSNPADSDTAEPLSSVYDFSGTQWWPDEQCPDGDGGNTTGHNSISVTFTKGGGNSQLTPVPPTDTPSPTGLTFGTATVAGCVPQENGNYFSGMATLGGEPANGYRVVYSWMPDGTPITDPVITGPHQGYPDWAPGYYSHMVSVAGAISGDWYVWIVDANGTRISSIAHWHSDGPGGACNDATVNFAG